MITAVHVTHEAVRKMGGIGTVLEGLVTAASYQQQVQRSILVGPLFDRQGPANERLGEANEIRYSSLDHIDQGNWAPRFEPVCRKYNVHLIYGTRTLTEEAGGRSATIEVLLVDISQMNRGVENKFKFYLNERFGVNSELYESVWDYEQYVRLALPAFEALKQLLASDGDAPVAVISHEYMGMPMALRVLLDNDPRMATIFHAHEVATVRPIVEKHPGHDTMFYNVLSRARREGLLLPDLFGAQTNYFKHGLISAAVRCDAVFAVGEHVRQELQFLSRTFAQRSIDVVPNGVPAIAISHEQRDQARGRLLDYAQTLLEWRPTYVFSHVARLVMSKGFWRDVHVLRALDEKLWRSGESAVFFLLSTEGAQRSRTEVEQMESAYGWPWNHRDGYPDLSGAEVAMNRFLQDFNRRSRAVKIVFVNQFGWEPGRCGRRMPQAMRFADIRQGTDLEFGQSIYEPFGISQFEPLAFGAICVPTNICGCVPFAQQQSNGKLPPQVLVADYVTPAGADGPARTLVNMSQQETDRVLAEVSAGLAEQVFSLLHQSGRQRADFLRQGRELASRMSWDVVAGDFFLPGVQRAIEHAHRRPSAGAAVPSGEL